ncbi:MAG: protein-L-isoaspartate(D-aspartate) O-methyltransferase [Candidatus Sumerlaeaceae bacterium]
MTNDDMIREQIEARGILNPRVLTALRQVDRARFVPEEHLAEAYADKPLPLAEMSTISQPYIVGLMTELLDPQPTDRILEIGCGSGYQTAVLAALSREVYSLEILPLLADLARFRLREFGVHNATVLQRSGWEGLAEHAPFERILVTAAPDHVPTALLDQLAVGGRMIVPLGAGEQQELLQIDKTAHTKFDERTIAPVRFVPMVHRPPEQNNG